MSKSALQHPETDPTPIFEHFRGSCASQLLTAAICYFDLFGRLAKEPLEFDDLASQLGLHARPANVLVTALRAMGMLAVCDNKICLSPLAAEHLVPGGAFDCGDYIGLAAQSPDVQMMVRMLKENKPMGSDDESGVGFIFRDGIESAMEASESARHFTMALAGRAKNVAPALADAVNFNENETLIDVGGGTGIYSYALLQKNASLSAVIFDRREVLEVAKEMAAEYGVIDRVEFRSADMFTDPIPANADVILLSNILHDWDVPECKELVSKCASALSVGGRLVIHDVFLDDDLGGPLPIALYSASLFSFTEGRAYSASEYRSWLTEASLTPQPIVPTRVHCGALTGLKTGTS